MHNVWTSIAIRAPCAARQTRAKPTLELFNGYARRYNSRWTQTVNRESRTYQRSRHQGDGFQKLSDAGSSRLAFSTTALLRAKGKKPPRPRDFKPKDDNVSGLQKAPRVATHTEGVESHGTDKEELTWRDYDPIGGMPLPGGELSQLKIGEIFGRGAVPADTGNYILSVMHWRRMSGALIDQQLSFPDDSGVPRQQAIKALEYLREVMPEVDEEANGQVWAEEENERLQMELNERAVKLRLYKREGAEEEQQEEEMESEQGTEEGRRRNQDSVLVKRRLENEARYEAEQAQKKVAAEKAEAAALKTRRGPLELTGGVQPDTQLTLYGPGGVSISAPRTKAWLQPVERKPWVKYYEDQAQIIKENVVPQLSTFRRLGPSFLVLLTILGASNFLSENYTPPPIEARMWSDYPPSVATLAGLSVTLLAFFLANRAPPLWRTYSKYFTLVPAYPYAVSILGATFRHDTFSHLASNVAVLWLTGLLLHEYVGRGTFLAIFFATGAIGGFTSLTWHVLQKSWQTYVFGISGAALGVTGAVCTLKPQGKISIAGFEVPIAAWVFLAMWGGLEIIGARRGLLSGVDHAGHVGGIVGGVACGLLFRMRARREPQAQEGDVQTVQMVRMEEE